MDNPKSQNDEKTPQSPQPAVRRTYRTPKLTQSGNIPEITGGPYGGTIDALTGGTGGFQGSTS